MKPNEYLWAVVNQFGWWFWIPFIFYGAYGLHKMYLLAAPETGLGRVIRVFLVGGFLCMIGILAFNGLGPFGFHLLAIGICLQIKQAYDHCKVAGKLDKSRARTMAGRLSERMMAKH